MPQFLIMMCSLTTRSVFAAVLLLTGGVLFFSCGKKDIPSGTPNCIIKKIEEIKSQPVRDPAAKVYSYKYHGETVYYITSYCCDMYSELYDSNCNLLCYPDGGITGGGDGKCTDFFSERSHEKLVWKDTR
ncbi:MAG: hypothetical protein FD123_211 [Bacteroidetes bacterium]|nr:MAG: hypothetical protein FD123_211 [Bacteroidota bacterium]